jgi:anti-sigma B factor antagonist
MMSRYDDADGRDGVEIAVEIRAGGAGAGRVRIPLEEGDGHPRVLVRHIERTALVRFLNAEVLFEESSVRTVGDQLDRLVSEDGHTRLLLDLSGVRYVSGAMLGRLAALQQKLGRVRGRIQLCGLDPLVRDVLRISRLEREFDLCDDEVQALGLILR